MDHERQEREDHKNTCTHKTWQYTLHNLNPRHEGYLSSRLLSVFQCLIYTEKWEGNIIIWKTERNLGTSLLKRLASSPGPFPAFHAMLIFRPGARLKNWEWAWGRGYILERLCPCSKLSNDLITNANGVAGAKWSNLAWAVHCERESFGDHNLTTGHNGSWPLYMLYTTYYRSKNAS